VSKKTEQERFTKVASDLLVGVRDLVNWGLDTGNTTPDMMRLTVTARKEAAVKLIEGGMSQRQAAKVLGVDQATISRDVMQSASKSDAKCITGSAATRARRATVQAKAEGVVMAAPSSKYRVLLADPPWDYGAHAQPDYQTEQRDHYPVMTLEEICALPVADWLEDDAVAFIWVTAPIIEKSFEVVRAWGLEYKAMFVWDKIKHNMGHYNSVRHEILLICTRGACQPDVKQLFDSVQSIERSDKHSQKPVEFYDIIETIYTHGRKLEMFQRGPGREGWDAWGLEADIEEVPSP
jgi:N6-adenosine-specific RNA methylase IME4